MMTRLPLRGATALLLGGLCLAQLATQGAVRAADKGPHDDAIDARQSMFRLYSFNFGTLSAMAKEKMPYDAERAAEAAANLDALANLGHGGLWPQGSDNATDGNAETRALPAIWEQYPDITDKVAALQEATAALKPVAGNGLDALQGAVNDVGGSCKGCHDDYRAEKN